MREDPGFHLDRLNVGRLSAPTDNMRLADFGAAFDRVKARGKMQLVNRRGPLGHKPKLHEAMERLAEWRADGDTGRAYGWSYIKEAQAWKTHGCARMAAE